MLRHDDIIENPRKRRSQKETNQYLYVQDRRIQLTFQRVLISDKIPVRMYNVEPDKISRIMYLIMFRNVTMENEPLHEKTCLSGLASLKKQVDLSYACADPEFTDPPPPGNSQVLY